MRTPMTQEGQYIYAIIETDQDRNFGLRGIGDGGNEVYTVRHGDVGAVISNSPIAQYPVTRANTMTHQKVMEEVMKHYPMLPVRFGTVAEGMDLIVEKLLKQRQEEFKKLLHYMRDKIELGLKAMWKDMKPVFEEIVAGTAEIGWLRDRLLKGRGGVQKDQVRLGEMVKKALEARKRREEQTILDPLDGLWVERKLNSPFGDQMITNSAFLVKRDKEKAFDLEVEKMSGQYDGRMVFKYVGPIPPCNFVEIVVKW
jgi:hypothetical protein